MTTATARVMEQEQAAQTGLIHSALSLRDGMKGAIAQFNHIIEQNWFLLKNFIFTFQKVMARNNLPYLFRLRN